MTENGRTLTYVGVALTLGVIALVFRPTQEPPTVEAQIGKPLFEKFTDPNKAASLKIVKYAEDLGEVSSFEVAKTANGLWTIPSHGNYPADAETQMKDAATALVGLTVLGVATENQADHELFGVREPNEKLQIGDKGVGLLVSFEDESGTDLGSLIVGKEVKNTPEQRFVRVPRQDKVFVVKMSPEKLSIKFEDWIEKDLLKISAFDVDRLRLKDHAVITTTQGPVAQPRSEVTVSLDANGSQWKLDEMLVFREGETKKSELLPGEELNKEKLDGLKNALSEIKIADVYQKPKGLDARLKTSGDFLNDREAQRSLAQRGFYLAKDDEVWSANGELQVRLKDGVEYVLRFGNVAGEQQDSTEGKLNRYLFVMARVDDSKFPAPMLETLPGEGAVPTAPTTPSAPGTPAAPATPAPGSTDKSPGTGDCGAQEEKPGDQKGTEPAAADKKEGEEKKGSQVKTEEPAKPKAQDAPPAAPEKKTEAPVGEEELKRKKLEAERERITKENQRKLDKWKEDKGKAEEKVRDLNARFAPWYYVISEDVYKKVHLSRSDIIKESAKSADEGTGLDAFRKLETEGIKKPAAAPPESAAPGGFPPGGFPPGGFPPNP
jgi:hypothetical protein